MTSTLSTKQWFYVAFTDLAAARINSGNVWPKLFDIACFQTTIDTINFFIYHKNMIEVAIQAARRKAAAPVSRIQTPKKLIAFGWYGGKFCHLGWLLPQLPECFHY